MLGWCLDDLRGFRRPLWAGYGRRSRWRAFVIVSYAFGGRPVLFAAVVWRTSITRRELVSARDAYRT